MKGKLSNYRLNPTVGPARGLAVRSPHERWISSRRNAPSTRRGASRDGPAAARGADAPPTQPSAGIASAPAVSTSQIGCSERSSPVVRCMYHAGYAWILPVW